MDPLMIRAGEPLGSIIGRIRKSIQDQDAAVVLASGKARRTLWKVAHAIDEERPEWAADLYAARSTASPAVLHVAPLGQPNSRPAAWWSGAA